ncbi:MAG: carboxypeptidase regulatory-like domain-containing protein [Candidatus Solibacter usitatus]|nr:carboxypeptidase regulatory-like domain-containing protein [Candidatus Solibacter usitatus]
MRSKWVLGLACLIFAAGLRADPPMTTLTIDVKSAESGKAVERASVVVKFVSGRDKLKLYKKIRTTWETRTNEGGVAKLPPIPQGKILVQVIAKGFQTFGQTYDVAEEEKTIEIKVNPPQPQYSAH